MKETTFKSISVVISRLNSLSHEIVGIASEFIGEEQRDKKAKTTTSVQCVMTFSVSIVS